MSALLVIGLCVLLGVVLARLRIFPDNAPQVLNLYVIWVALPALILVNLAEFSFSLQALIPMVTAWSALLVSALLVWVLCKVMNWDRATRCVLMLLVPLGNTSFVGIPMVSALVGEAAIPYTILYDQLGSFLALATYGTLVIAMHSGEPVKASNIARKVLFFPPFVALIAGSVINLTGGLPAALNQSLAMIGATLVPVVMLAVGLQWRFRLEPQDSIPMVWGLLIKLVLAPLGVALVFAGVHYPAVFEQTMVLEAAMAPMISAGALATLHQQRPNLASAMVGYGILAGFITVPAWWWLLNESGLLG